jgi:hypothetical protein
MDTLKGRILAVGIAISCIMGSAIAQDSSATHDSIAVISGAVGEISTVQGGFTFHQPVIAPVLTLPLGNRVLIESRADLREFISQSGPGATYTHQFFSTLEYLQADIILNRQVTLVAGRYLTPFGIYTERISPIWVRNFQQAPIIFTIGTRSSGSSDGAMLRGAAYDNSQFTLNYAAYFSANDNGDKFESGRAAGGRAGLFLKGPRLEIGASYQRFLQDTHYNAAGAYLSFQPRRLAADIKGEFAHSPSGYGYWLEALTREHTKASPSWVERTQLGVRAQQFVRKSFLPGDSLPSRNTQQIDGAVNYYLPREVRFTFSYGRQFTAVQQSNVWNVGLTYRFMLPIGGRS